MAEIKHRIAIKAAPARVYAAIATQAGLRGWWTADSTVNNVMSPDGKLHAVLPVSVVFMAVRQNGKWFIQDERAYFMPMPSGE